MGSALSAQPNLAFPYGILRALGLAGSEGGEDTDLRTGQRGEDKTLKSREEEKLFFKIQNSTQEGSKEGTTYCIPSLRQVLPLRRGALGNEDPQLQVQAHRGGFGAHLGGARLAVMRAGGSSGGPKTLHGTQWI